MKASAAFSADDRERIRAAVAAAEKQTSGEIRIYIEDTCREDVMDRAAFIFEQLKMQQTDKRNGVLIYLAVSDKKFAVLGDAGIHAIVGQDFWNSVKALLESFFRQEQFTDGLIAGVTEAGKVLSEHFPYSRTDSNELPDDMVIG
jgi:uncharacterized membrane protein